VVLVLRMFLMPEKVHWKFELIDSETGEVKNVLKEGESVINREYHEWTLNLTKEQIEEQSKDLKYWPDPSDLEDEEIDST